MNRILILPTIVVAASGLGFGLRSDARPAQGRLPTLAIMPPPLNWTSVDDASKRPGNADAASFDVTKPRLVRVVLQSPYRER